MHFFYFGIECGKKYNQILNFIYFVLVVYNLNYLGNKTTDTQYKTCTVHKFKTIYISCYLNTKVLLQYLFKFIILVTSHTY